MDRVDTLGKSTPETLLCQLYILVDRALDYQRKVEALGGKQNFIHTLLKIALPHLKLELE